MTYQNLLGAAKAFLRGKFIPIQSYIKKLEKFQINILTLHINEQVNPQISQRKEIIKNRNRNK